MSTDRQDAKQSWGLGWRGSARHQFRQKGGPQFSESKFRLPGPGMTGHQTSATAYRVNEM